jgi:hypothetical protein
MASDWRGATVPLLLIATASNAHPWLAKSDEIDRRRKVRDAIQPHTPAKPWIVDLQ